MSNSAAQNVLTFPANTSPLQFLQNHFGIVDLGGELRVVDLIQLADIQRGVGPESLSFYRRAEGNIKMRRSLEGLPQKSNPKQDVEDFWRDPATSEFDRIAFTPLPTGPKTINLWVPPTVLPMPGGSWDLILNFLFDGICSGDVKLLEYLLKFLAHMLQKPQDKPGVIIVLLGGQGTGKGTFFRLLGRIWGRTALFISDVNQIVGTFNASLERNYVICMDEALFAGDKKAIENLKSLVTEPVIHVEQKYQPSHSIESFHRFFATSNNDHFGQVDSDDRRFVFIRVSDRFKADSGYFTPLYAEIESDSSLAAMVHDLMNFDLSTYNPRLRPKTDEHGRQKTQSLRGFDGFWYESLRAGKVPTEHLHEDWTDGFVSTSQLKDGCKAHDPQAQRYRPIQDDQIAARLRKLCPSAKTSRQTTSFGKSRGYVLPDLTTARKDFEAHIGSSIDWGAQEGDRPADPDETGADGPDKWRDSRGLP